MVTPGEAANIGGRPMTGVAGPERLRQVDDLKVPPSSASTTCVSSVDVMIASTVETFGTGSSSSDRSVT